MEPDNFSINQGISVAEPPLIRSIGVELKDDSFSRHVFKGVLSQLEVSRLLIVPHELYDLLRKRTF